MTNDASTDILTFSTPPSVVARNVGDETVIVDLESERYFSLNSAGSVIWSAFVAGRSVEQAVSDVVERFDVERTTAARDVGELVSELTGRGLLEPTS